MSQFLNYFRGLSKPVRFTSYAYVSMLISYNIISTYSDAKKKLIAFRNNKLTRNEQLDIYDEWSAVKYGAEEFYIPRFCNSLIWPIKVCANVIPSVVLFMNKDDMNDMNDMNKDDKKIDK